MVVASMNIQQLRYFCSVMKAGTFSAAAREEGVSVQAVSKALAALEDEVGRPLFLRKNKGVIATTQAHRFQERAQRAVVAFDEAEAFVRASRDELPRERDALSILIAVPSFNNHVAVCRGLERFLSGRLGMAVSVGICSGADAIPHLLSHELDVLIAVGEYEDARCDATVFGSLPTGAFVTGSHPLAVRGSVTLADLAPYPVCHASGLDDFNETILNRYRAHGLASPVRVVRSQEAFEHLVLEERGYAFGVGIQSLSAVPDGRLLRIDEPGALSVPVCAITARDFKSDHYRALERFMLKEFPQFMAAFAAGS